MERPDPNLVHKVFFTYDKDGNEIFEEFEFTPGHPRLNKVLNYSVLIFHKIVLNFLSLKVQVILTSFILSIILLKMGHLLSEDFRYALIGIVAPAAVMRGVSEVGNLIDKNFKIKKIRKLSESGVNDSSSYISSDYSFIKSLTFFNKYERFGRFFNYFMMVLNKLIFIFISVKFQIIVASFVVSTWLLVQNNITSEDWAYINVGIITPCVTMSDIVEIGKLINSTETFKKITDGVKNVLNEDDDKKE